VRATVALLIGGAIACAAETPAVVPPPSEAAKASAPEAPKAEASKPVPAPKAPTATKPGELAVELDLAVLEFSALAEELTKDDEGAKSGWPERARSAFVHLIGFLDSTLDRPPGDFPVPLMIRTRVALDTEVDRLQKRFGPVPEPLKRRFDRACALLTRHVRAKESPNAAAPEPDLKLAWPLRKVIISSRFGKRSDPIGERRSGEHMGIDLAADRDEVVLAAASGRVVRAGWMGGGGNAVVLRHVAGFVTLYMHLKDVAVSAGDWVDAQKAIGYVGSTGIRVTGPHLHFEVRRRGVPIDPEKLLPAIAPSQGTKTPTNQR
jgi:murein DD-endopeptidase MepM/ murein hydrolase activator NlpD